MDRFYDAIGLDNIVIEIDGDALKSGDLKSRDLNPEGLNPGDLKPGDTKPEEGRK